MMPSSMGDEFDRLGLTVERPRGDFVEKRLPHMQAGSVEQRYGGLAASTQRIPEPRGKLKPRRAGAHDQGAMQARVHTRARLWQIAVESIAHRSGRLVLAAS